jgi:hypothetical protein
MSLVGVREGVWAKRTLLCPRAVHRVVHTPERKRPLNELGFPRFPQHAFALGVFRIVSATSPMQGHASNERGRILPRPVPVTRTRAVDGTA